MPALDAHEVALGLEHLAMQAQRSASAGAGAASIGLAAEVLDAAGRLRERLGESDGRCALVGQALVGEVLVALDDAVTRELCERGRPD